MVKESSSRESGVKKKRKTTNNTEPEPEVDIYKKVVEFEEKESLKRSADEDAKIYFNVCKDIRSALAEIAKLKSKKTDNSQKIMELSTACCLNIVLLKKLNRMEKVRLVVAKDSLNAEKQKVDSINLQYQNLLYEAHHLISEASKCFQFKSKDEDIELVAIGEFMANAPEEITSKFTNMDENDEALKHELRLARLEWELKQRKNLAALCKSMEEEKKKLGTEIIQLRNRLDGLTPRLATVLEATKPLQEHLDLPVDKIRAEHKLASLLPSALYLFYANADAYKQVFDIRTHVVIVGDSEEASQWHESRAMCFDSPEVEEEEQEGDTVEAEDGAEIKKRRHRRSVQTDPIEERKKKLLETHPLAVEVSTNLKDGLSLKMKFQYYTQLKIITCTSSTKIPDKITANTAREVLTGESILTELIAGDLGLESPNPTNLYQLKKAGFGSYESLVSNIGYAYIWAQKVCGFDYLSKQMSKGGSDLLSQSSVENVMKTLRKRLEARYALALQLQQLEKNIVPELPAEIACPKNHVSTLNKWLSSTYQQFCEGGATEDLVEGEYIQPTDMFYSANINRANVNLQMKIAIKSDYPLTPPVFSLSLKYNGNSYNATNDDDVRDMERAINIGWNYGAASAPWLLAAQITYLCSFVDVYLETKDPENFPQTTMFFRSICARNRRRPFKFKKFGTGIFIQY